MKLGRLERSRFQPIQRLSQRENGLTFIRCRVAPRNMHEIRSKRARYAFRTESNDAVFPINTRLHPPLLRVEKNDSSRESYLETCLYPIYHCLFYSVISFNPLCIGRNICKIFHLIIVFVERHVDMEIE